MTDPRPWHASYAPGVPISLEPYPNASVYSLLQNAVAGFPKRPALAFFGAKMTYEALLGEVERFSAVLASLGVHAGDRVGLDPAELPRVRDRVVRVPADRRRRGGQQPPLHRA